MHKVVALLAGVILVLLVAPAADGRTQSQRATPLICLPSSKIQPPKPIRCAPRVRATSTRRGTHTPR
jgi:hypothetical protein